MKSSILKLGGPFPSRNVAVALLLLITLLSADARAQSHYEGWHTDLDRAAEIAAKNNKPIFLVFRCVR